MYSYKILSIGLFFLYLSTTKAQYLTIHSGLPETVFVETYWGDVRVEGKKVDRVRLKAIQTNSNGEVKIIEQSSLEEFVEIRKTGREVHISARRPIGFESIILVPEVQEKANVHVRIHRGGELSMTRLMNRVEIDHRNGSVELEAMGGYAIAHIANGSNKAPFESVDPSKVISLIAMNGEISITLPPEVSRDVRLISRKNGFVRSDYNLNGVSSGDIYYEDKEITESMYSSNPINISTKINGGGPLLFASTENGPVYLLKSK